MSEVVKKRWLRQGRAIGKIGFKKLNISTSTTGGKPTFRINRLADELVLRRVNRNIRRITRVKQSDRVAIVNCISTLASEGYPFRIYKIDVKSFYETIDVDAILDQLESDSAFPRQSVMILRSLFRESSAANISGLLRGLAISSTLSEYAMRRFDEAVLTWSEVNFYARFVDDIIVFTDGNEPPRHFLKRVQRELYDGLGLNWKKTRFMSFPAKGGAPNTQLAQEFEYLGYKFEIRRIENNSKNRLEREVQIDIAASKVKKIKTRIILSFKQFDLDGNFEDLSDRLKLLSGNFTIYDKRKLTKRKSGIFFNYRMVHAEKSKSLPELDKFLRGAILNPNVLTGAGLGPIQKSKLLKIQISQGFAKRTFYHFPPNRLAYLMECWAYV